MLIMVTDSGAFMQQIDATSPLSIICKGTIKIIFPMKCPQLKKRIENQTKRKL